jgi:hypothetical protein
VHVRTVNVHVQAQLAGNVLDVLETLLVVGTSTTNPDLDVVLDKEACDLAEGLDDTLEGRGNVGEVGNSPTDEQDLALGVLRSTEHEVEDSLGVVEGLRLSGCTRVLAVIGKLGGKTSRGNGISVHDGSTTTGDESPNATLRVEDGQLKGGTSLCVKLSNVSFLLGKLTTEGGGELHRRTDIDVCLAGGGDRETESTVRTGDGPLGTTFELGSLVNLGSQVEEVDFGRGGIGVGDDDEGVDLEVAGEVVSIGRGR